MGMDISREVEARLTDEARKLGISVNELLKQWMTEHGASTVSSPSRPLPELPVLHLGAMDALHRRDIYNDVR
jgi:hypothetical protein